MKKVAKFAKVSKEQFIKDCEGFSEEAEALYEDIKLPLRATSGSAGYDFFAPRDITLAPGESVKIPTGIRALIAEGWVLLPYPRSGLGFKYRLQLDNTVGVIDSDYFFAENEGHIMVKLVNHGDHTLTLAPGERFCQGIFLPYGLAEEETIVTNRYGGLGSTGTR